MNAEEWYKEKNDRQLRYAGRVLDPLKSVLLRADYDYASRYDGQVAIITAANLFARMTPSVALDIPSVSIVQDLPSTGSDLREFILDMVFKADPYGKFEFREQKSDDYVVDLGRTGPKFVTHGSGWNFYRGPAPSPLVEYHSAIPIGPAMAAIMAASIAFKANLKPSSETTLSNAIDWNFGKATIDAPEFLDRSSFGNIWVVGAGSVGTAILYFLTLATRSFFPTLFDMDVVKIHNLDRSPIFTKDHIGKSKVDATAAWLRKAGVSNVNVEACALDETPLWINREAGIPDLLVAAANERKVRSVIENNFPPIQIYGTTGKNWQATVLRHIPMEDPCSLCLFPETEHLPTQCATGQVSVDHSEEKVDAAMPFLSFAAGAMAAAEILKANCFGYPFTPSRVVLNTEPTIKTVKANFVRKENCTCGSRSKNVHRKMIAGSRYSSF